MVVEGEKKIISFQDSVHRIISSEEMRVNLGILMDFHFLQEKVKVSLATAILNIKVLTNHFEAVQLFLDLLS